MAACPISSGAPPADACPVTGGGLVPSKLDRLIRVVVIDDDARVRAAIGKTLALEVDLAMVGDAASADAAVALVERTYPAVALVDVLLPDDIIGLELIKSLSQRPGCAVVALSVRTGLRHAALGAGAHSFVEKGSDIDLLLGAVRAAAGSRYF